MLLRSPSGLVAVFPSAVDRLPGHTQHLFSTPRQRASAHWSTSIAGIPTEPHPGINADGEAGELRLRSPSSPKRLRAPLTGVPVVGTPSASGRFVTASEEITLAAAAGSAAAVRAASAAAVSAVSASFSSSIIPRQYNTDTFEVAGRLLHPYSASARIPPSTATLGAAAVTAPRSGRSVSISTGTGRLSGAVTVGLNSTSKLPAGFPGQRQYARVLQAAKGARPSEAASFRQEMDAMDSVRKEGIKWLRMAASGPDVMKSRQHSPYRSIQVLLKRNWYYSRFVCQS